MALSFVKDIFSPSLDFRNSGSATTNGEGGPVHITVNGMASDSELGKRSRQPSKVLAGYLLDAVVVSI